MPTVKVLKEQAKAKGNKKFRTHDQGSTRSSTRVRRVDTKSPPKVKKGEFKGTKFLISR